MLNYKDSGLILDDERNLSDISWVELPVLPYSIVRSYNEFVEIISKFGLPKHISFDCDLDSEEHYPWCALTALYFERGEIPYHLYKEKTGYDAARWLVEYCKERDLDLPTWTVHSMNVLAAKHTKDYLKNYTYRRGISPKDLKQLQELERLMLEEKNLSMYVVSLIALEKYLGVYDEEMATPRWQQVYEPHL